MARLDAGKTGIELRYGIVTRREDFSVLRMYPEKLKMEGTKTYVCQSEEDPTSIERDIPDNSPRAYQNVLRLRRQRLVVIQN